MVRYSSPGLTFQYNLLLIFLTFQWNSNVKTLTFQNYIPICGFIRQRCVTGVYPNDMNETGYFLCHISYISNSEMFQNSQIVY